MIMITEVGSLSLVLSITSVDYEWVHEPRDCPPGRDYDRCWMSGDHLAIRGGDDWPPIPQV